MYASNPSIQRNAAASFFWNNFFTYAEQTVALGTFDAALFTGTVGLEGLYIKYGKMVFINLVWTPSGGGTIDLTASRTFTLANDIATGYFNVPFNCIFSDYTTADGHIDMTTKPYSWIIDTTLGAAKAEKMVIQSWYEAIN